MARATPVKIAIIANASQAAGVFKKTAGEAKTWGQRVGGAIKGVAKVGAGAALGLIGLSLTKGFQRLNNLDTAKTKMKALGFSSKATKSMMDSALKSVKGTAFGLDEAATSAASAAAAGVKQGKAMDGYLKMIADGASITGRSMTDFGAIVNKVQTNGVASMAELNQINDAGIGITQALAKEYGVSAIEMKKMVSSGKVDAATFNKVLGKMTNDAAKTMGETLPAKVANMVASLGRIGAAFLENVFPAMKGGADKILDTLGSFEDKAVGVAKKVNDSVQGLVAFLQDIDLSALTEKLETLREKGSKAIESLKNTVEPLGNTLSNIWTLIEPAVTALTGFVLGTGFAVLELALDGISKAAEPVANGLEKITDWAVKNESKLKTAAIVIGVLLTPVIVGLGIAAGIAAANAGALLVYGAVSKAMGIGLKIAAAAQWLFNTAMLANPITWIVVAIIALIAVIVLLVVHWDTVTAAIGKAWDWIKTKTSEAITAVVDWVKGLGSKVKNGFTSFKNNVVDAFKRAWDTAKSTTITKIAEVITWVKGIPGRVKNAVGNLGNTLKDAARKLIQGFIDGIKAKWNDVKDTFTKLTDKLPSWKGPAARDKKLLKRPAALIMDGFIDQINERRNKLRKTLQAVTKDINTMGGTNPTIGGTFTLDAATAGAGGSHTITINVSAGIGTNPAEIGREIKRNLDAYYRAGGRA